jgi:(E)-4-hydroxy-3-methylbut-2-enyl-diphosphate synthase
LERRKTREVSIGVVRVGGEAPVSVQSMTKTPAGDVQAALEQIGRLAAAGCEIVRVAVPTKGAARPFKDIVRESPIPVVADVHFSGETALAAVKAGAHALRINPGNMRNRELLSKIANAAGEAGIPIRVGLNSGSVAGGGKIEGGEAQALAGAALEAARELEGCGFRDIIISAKSSSVRSTVEAYRKIARATDCPLHLGVTAAGPEECAAVRSSIGIGALLLEGIGDTIRVSVTGDPVREVAIAREILDSLDIRRFGPRIVSCPTCGRCEVDLPRLVREVQAGLLGVDKHVTVAVMGCVVNGPGEASEADVGAAFSRSEAWIFSRGEKLRRVGAEEVAAELLKEIEEL